MTILQRFNYLESYFSSLKLFEYHDRNLILSFCKERGFCFTIDVDNGKMRFLILGYLEKT